MRLKQTYFLLLALLLSVSLHAQLRVAPVFGDHMVLQQQAPVPIWGWASPTQNLTVKVSWDTTTFNVKADNTTFWGTTIFTPVAGGPHTITIHAGHETLTIKDVLIGEVWICSGQSNMEWSMEASADGKGLIGEVNDPTIRLLHIPKSAAITPQVRSEGSWETCNAETVRDFSAVAYFFAKKIQGTLNVPVGIINTSWGGTPAEAWMPKEKVEANPALRASAEKQVDDKPWCPTVPGVVYNSMLNPLAPYRIAGALWYQGEANTVAPATYKLLMETMITEWRKKFLTEFPFYYVQIAPFAGYSGNAGTLLRDQQTKMRAIPRTEMVVVSDLVDDIKDIHPKYKKPVGERLANIALADTYGKKGIAYQSPLYKSMAIEKGKVRITFDYAPNGLTTKNGDATDFMIAGDDKKFYPAKVRIDGNTVVVSAKEVKKPVAVRFAWRNDAMPNLFSKEGLPAASFRTDEWEE